ncbi:MAG: hypothetical protein RL753_875 [Bacteroidota bacterium]|jgi:hypothetical protein
MTANTAATASTTTASIREDNDEYPAKFGDCCWEGGYWTNLYDDTVYCCAAGCSSSLPRDMYDDDEEYQKRSALHNEVIPVFRRLRELAAEEHRLARLGVHPRDPKMNRLRTARRSAILALQHAHWLTERGD